VSTILEKIQDLTGELEIHENLTDIHELISQAVHDVVHEVHPTKFIEYKLKKITLNASSPTHTVEGHERFLSIHRNGRFCISFDYNQYNDYKVGSGSIYEVTAYTPGYYFDPTIEVDGNIKPVLTVIPTPTDAEKALIHYVPIMEAGDSELGLNFNPSTQEEIDIYSHEINEAIQIFSAVKILTFKMANEAIEEEDDETMALAKAIRDDLVGIFKHKMEHLMKAE